MRTSCLVNNYNYRQFIGAAVDSALHQTLAFDEIIVVDDGSTDGSVEFLRQRYGKNPRVQTVAKRNGGQLSCFNAAFARATGDIIFFLDADDIYANNYVERTLAAYENSPTHDCVMAAFRTFGETEGHVHPTSGDVDLGYSVLSTLFRNAWQGNPTSCLSFRRSLLERILPHHKLRDWRTRADDCLVLGSSLVGGRKFQLAAPLVHYRVHDSNHFLGRETDSAADFRHELARNRLVEHFISQQGYNRDKLPEFAHLEFAAAGSLSFARLKHYVGIVRRSKLRLRHRLSIVKKMLKRYWAGPDCEPVSLPPWVQESVQAPSESQKVAPAAVAPAAAKAA